MGLEHWWFTVPLRLRSILRRRLVERELDEELQFHLLHRTEEGLARGLTAAGARAAAMRAMNGLDQRKEEIRDARRIHWLTDFVDDTRFALRSLRRTPGLTVFVAITLALGIGMSAAAFSMVDGLILRPYPVPDPGSVVNLVSTTRDNGFDDFSYREYLDIRRATKSHDGVIASGPLQGVGFSVEPGSSPRVRGGMLVSGNYFHVLGVEPTLGRGFREDEDRVTSRDAVVVLGPDFWKHEFGGDPSVVGRIVRLNGTDFTVIGVAPESFPGMMIFLRPDFYVPLAMARFFPTNPQAFFESRSDRELTVRARLRHGVTLQQAGNELAALAQHFEREYPKTNRDRGAAVRTQFEMRTRDDATEWKFIVVFAVLSLAVLLVACTNVAGLLLSRARTRTREIAIRLAMGAGRFRLIRMLLAESLVLACLASLGGIAVAYAAIQFFHTLSIPSELPVFLPFRLDTRVLVASLALAVLSALLCGLAPALQSTRADLVNGLKSADIGPLGHRRLRSRHALVIAQVSVSLLLLAASFLMMHGFQNGAATGTTFTKDHLLMARFDPRLRQYNAAQTERFYRLLTERARALPGVRSAGLTRNPPLGLDAFDSLAFVPDDMAMPRDRKNFTSAMDTVNEEFFAAMGIAVVRGRGFLASDTADAPQVAVVNEQFATHYWPGKVPIGKHIRLDHAAGPLMEIVGVVRTLKYRHTTEKPTDFVYIPLAQHRTARLLLLLQSTGDPRQLLEPLKGVVRTLDANMPLSETRTYEEVYRYQAVEGPRSGIQVVVTMGIVGLVLAVAGLYGLVSYTVSRRTHEIGIRMAIGATPSDVLRLMMSQGLMLVGTGTAVGFVLGLGLERILNSFLFNAGGVDIPAYLIVVSSLWAATALAVYLPARRASRIAPAQALRDE